MTCAGLAIRYAMGCKEFRGLQACSRCKRWYCWRHCGDHICVPDEYEEFVPCD